MKIILVAVGVVLAVIAVVLAPSPTTFLLAGAIAAIGISTVTP